MQINDERAFMGVEEPTNKSDFNNCSPYHNLLLGGSLHVTTGTLKGRRIHGVAHRWWAAIYTVSATATDASSASRLPFSSGDQYRVA